MTVGLYVADIPEFRAVLEAARRVAGCRVHAPMQGYWLIESDGEMAFERKPMKLPPALWYSMLSGGFHGHILEYGRDRLVIGVEIR